jgi:pilus assembly protein Flp/PilA
MVVEAASVCGLFQIGRRNDGRRLRILRPPTRLNSQHARAEYPLALFGQIHVTFRFEVYAEPIKLIRRFLADETGATAIEYGLIAAGISLAIIAVVNGLGTKLNTKFTSINTSLR